MSFRRIITSKRVCLGTREGGGRSDIERLIAIFFFIVSRPRGRDRGRPITTDQCVRSGSAGLRRCMAAQ